MLPYAITRVGNNYNIFMVNNNYEEKIEKISDEKINIIQNKNKVDNKYNLENFFEDIKNKARNN